MNKQLSIVSCSGAWLLLLSLTSHQSSSAFVVNNCYYPSSSCASSSNTILLQNINKPQQFLSTTTALDAVTDPNNNFKSAVLTREEYGPLIQVGKGTKGQEKVINWFGGLSLLLTIVTGPFWSLAMKLIEFGHNLNEDFDKDRALYDYTGKIWCRIWMTIAQSFPEISGIENVEIANESAVVFVANHCSWLDIQVICCAIDPVFKFIAKGDLTKIPLIGQQLVGGNHILLEREDRKSQLKTFKESIKLIKNGVSIMAFPEGQRSPDGKMIDFKGGSFAIATKTGAPIVPISISNTHAIMPMDSLLPVQTGGGKLAIHIHPPIDPAGKTEEEITQLVREAISSKLPLDQIPLDILDNIQGEKEEELLSSTVA